MIIMFPYLPFRSNKMAMIPRPPSKAWSTNDSSLIHKCSQAPSHHPSSKSIVQRIPGEKTRNPSFEHTIPDRNVTFLCRLAIRPCNIQTIFWRFVRSGISLLNFWLRRQDAREKSFSTWYCRDSSKNWGPTPAIIAACVHKCLSQTMFPGLQRSCPG